MDEKTRKAASVRDRLKSQAIETGRTYMELQQYYAMEKFLLRLSKSEYSENFILKGALLLRFFGIGDMRPTRDIDLSGYISENVAEAEQVIRACLNEAKVEEDGLHFDADSISAEEIREHQSYGGIRVTFLAFLGKARIHMQIDIGFGDAITPGPILIEIPQLLDDDPIPLRGYTLESAIAEKFEAMVALDMANSRMKDFYDIWFLCNTQSFHLDNLCAAVKATFDRRKTALPTDLPTALSSEFVKKQHPKWKAFLKKNSISEPDTTMYEVVDRLKEFLWPVVEELHRGHFRTLKWEPSEGWP